MNAVALLILAVAPAVDLPPICTDRPTKANATCTVLPGAFQVETSAIAWSLTKAAGTRTELTSIGSSVAKLGLTERSDLQIGFTPHLRLTVEQEGARDARLRVWGRHHSLQAPPDQRRRARAGRRHSVREAADCAKQHSATARSRAGWRFRSALS